MSESRPSPIPSPQTKAFWEAASRKVFMVPRCHSCSRVHWYPRPFCPHCYSNDVELEEASGRATVYSFTVVGKDQPQIVAYAQLEEGPILLTNIVETDPGSIAIGSPLVVAFDTSENGMQVPVFRGA
ncbi:Zn-ribbon domain-containing OB-fold protein [Mesorhizobium sp. ANAO-SY3R2]|uniref:Zn-ribbon domain-containing OB-fold protein n=1 Tax=Mesorhizobium sp. ANAO-SY3R2 TaxID=3166644 RepID=UPI003671170E